MIYARISRDRVGAGLGIARQEAECRELAAARGLTVREVFADNDISAYSGKPRPGYRALLEAIRSGTVGTVIAWHTDRLHRSPAELEEYIDACDAGGVITITVKAGPLDLATPAGKLIARQLGAVARFEVEHMIERQRSAKAQAAAAGRWKGGRRPYGYENDGVTVRPDEAAAVAMMADHILSGGSLRSLVPILNARGYTTSTGAPWREDAVRAVLLRPRNAGLMEHRGEIIGPASWPPILDPDRWRAVKAVLEAPGRRTQWSSARRWLLSGLALCGVCGSPVKAHKTGGRGRTPTYNYICPDGRHVGRIAREVDALVTEVTIARLADAELVAPRAGADDEVSRAHAELAEVRQRLDDLAAAFGAGAIDASQLTAATEALRARQRVAEATVARASSGSALAGVLGAPDIRRAWSELGLDRKRAIIDTLMVVKLLPARKGRPAGWRPGQPYFDPRTVAIDWRAP